MSVPTNEQRMINSVTSRLFTASLVLAIVTFVFVGRAEAQQCKNWNSPFGTISFFEPLKPWCVCRLPLRTSYLQPTGQFVLKGLVTRYEAKYVETYHSPICGKAFNWTLEAAVSYRGIWNLVTKQATDEVSVKIVSNGATVATYSGRTVQKCTQNPWEVYGAGCPFKGLGVTKVEKASGWGTSSVPWTGFNYDGPWPAARPSMPCCWFQPWG